MELSTRTEITRSGAKTSREGHERAAALVEKSCHAIAVAALDGIVVYLNESGHRLTGVGAGEVENGRVRLQALFPDEHARRWEREVMPSILGGGTWQGEWCLRHACNSGLVPVEASVFTISDNDESEIVIEARGLAAQRERDAERAALERQLQHAIKMEAVGRLAGGIAHDFNNLLTAMAGFSEIVLDRLDEDDPLRTGAEQTLRTCHRSAAMIRQLLVVSRRQVSQPVVMDINRLIADMGKLLEGLIGEDIQFRVDLDTNPVMVCADPAQMEQVLLNLVVNARDAMPTGGTLSVRSESVALDETHARRNVGARTGPHVHLSVSDTGEGIDRETLARVFEPFFTTKKGKGSGLGLATVYGIVQQCKGHVSVDSVPGRGTVFHIYLPEVDERASRPADDGPAEPASVHRGETVLVVEDDSVVRLVVREKPEGCRLRRSRSPRWDRSVGGRCRPRGFD